MRREDKLSTAINSIYSGMAVWYGNSIETLRWDESNSMPKPTQEQIDTEWERLLLFDAKTQTIQSVKQRYYDVITSPFLWTDGNTYQCDAEARQNIGDAMAVISAINPSGWVWFDITNVQRTFVISDFKMMVASMWDRGQRAYEIMQFKKNEIEAIDNISGVLAYDVNSGLVIN